MRFFNLVLTPHEVDAYCADYLEENTLRADVARALLRLSAVVARMTTEMEELKRCENSPSLWKLHADSLIVLLEVGSAADQNAARVFTLATQQGETEKVEAIQASVLKLGDCSELAVKALTGGSTRKSVGATASV
jgi:hypothetical protein